MRLSASVARVTDSPCRTLRSALGVSAPARYTYPDRKQANRCGMWGATLRCKDGAAGLFVFPAWSEPGRKDDHWAAIKPIKLIG